MKPFIEITKILAQQSLKFSVGLKTFNPCFFGESCEGACPKREKVKLDWKNLGFGYAVTDYNCRAFFKNGKWSEPTIFPDETINLSIAAQFIHYGQNIFEGIKVFEQKNGDITAFRPIENAKRFIQSAKACEMVPVPEELFMKTLDKVVQLNHRWVPPYGSGASLYVRPFQMGVEPLMGVKPSLQYTFIILVTPVGAYFKSGFKPGKFAVADDLDRAAPFGLGKVKAAANYVSGLRGTVRAKHDGYNEIIYLDCVQRKYIEESGPANFIAITKDNKYVTPKSSSILTSITNMSLREIAEKDFGMTVEERPISVDELADFEEVGACGTAAIISPIHSITYKDKVFTYGSPDKAGPKLTQLYNHIRAIQLGEAEDKYNWNYKFNI